MDKEQIIQDENNIYEKKASLADEKRFLAAVCALANAEGGTIAVGVRNKEIVGVKNTEDCQKKAADLITSSLKPVPQIRISQEEINAQKLVFIYVFPSEELCAYKGRVYVRIGSVNRLLEGKELINFLQTKKFISFEEKISDFGVEEISSDKIKRYLALRGLAMEAPLEKTLLNMRIAKNGSGLRLKNLAFLLFAGEMASLFPHSGVKLVEFEGKTPTNILRHKVITNTVFELIDETVEIIKDYTLQKTEIRGMKREEKYLYPLEAVRELVVNAVGHRDYFDRNLVQISLFKNRMEITNPGTPLAGLENLGSLAAHRNPNLYLYLSFARYSEGYGTGIPRVIKLLKNNGFPPLRFEVIGSFFKTTLFIKEFGDRKTAILEHLRQQGELSSTELAEQMGISSIAVYRHLQELLKHKKVGRKGKGKKTRYYLL